MTRWRGIVKGGGKPAVVHTIVFCGLSTPLLTHDARRSSVPPGGWVSAEKTVGKGAKASRLQLEIGAHARGFRRWWLLCCNRARAAAGSTTAPRSRAAQRRPSSRLNSASWVADGTGSGEE